MRLRSSLLATFLLASALTFAAPAAPACAAGSSAVLVVATGGNTYRYCVALPSHSVSGLELIRLAGKQHGLQYSLGYGGRAVCRLAGVGPEGDDCFADHPNFWGYWRGNGSGGWTWSSTGAGSTTVRNGDVEGWAWGSGQDGNTHPQPPATTYGSVCTSSPGGSGGSDGSASSGKATGKGTGKANAPPPGTTEGATEADNRPDVTEGSAENDDGSGTRAKQERKKEKAKAKTGTDPAGDTSEETAEETSDAEREIAGSPLAVDEGPPPAGLIGIGLAVLFGLFGARLAARRQTRAR